MGSSDEELVCREKNLCCRNRLATAKVHWIRRCLDDDSTFNKYMDMDMVYIQTGGPQGRDDGVGLVEDSRGEAFC